MEAYISANSKIMFLTGLAHINLEDISSMVIIVRELRMAMGCRSGLLLANTLEIDTKETSHKESDLDKEPTLGTQVTGMKEVTKIIFGTDKES